MLVAADLHGHTLFSVGRTSPEDFVVARAERRMLAVAITDRDVLTGVRRGEAAATLTGTLFVPGVEITSTLRADDGSEEPFHLLAYYPHDILRGAALEGRDLYRRGLEVQEGWRDVVLDWLDALAPEDLHAIDPDARIASLPPRDFPPFVQLAEMVRRRRRSLLATLRDRHEAFARAPSFAWSPEEAIDAIRADGALDFVAHGWTYRNVEGTRDVVRYASGLELSGSPSARATELRIHAEAAQKPWIAAADETPLRATGSSTLVPLTTIEMLLGCRVSRSLILAA